jgi:hypothetical protein
VSRDRGEAGRGLVRRRVTVPRFLRCSFEGETGGWREGGRQGEGGREGKIYNRERAPASTGGRGENESREMRESQGNRERVNDDVTIKSEGPKNKPCKLCFCKVCSLATKPFFQTSYLRFKKSHSFPLHPPPCPLPPPYTPTNVRTLPSSVNLRSPA